MSGIRPSGTRLAVAAATAALAALSLTACGNDATGARAEPTGTNSAASTATAAPDPSATSPATSPAANPASSKALASSGQSGSGGPKPTTRHTTAKPPASSGKPVTCQASDTKTVAAPLNRPVNHMLLTVTNTGSRTCYLYAYPALQFTGAQAVPPVIADSHPQAVVTLAPGESGYASVTLAAADGTGTNGYTAKTLAVYFYGRSGNESVGAAAHPPLPAKGLYIDSTLKTTYWQQSMDDALNW
ncbi:DUF4232 domain-containing protein [Actinacidiphila paucisporea]|uniref:DUF4232 domain-containing protein n=1 Tax=Actinacidiphila paucisporea TaxID=310782 RepID=A0A1M7IAP9_9ACTN|nr:DUF4232 domain-containing protein [Actinacidiphila paucisporea]SHM37658.1 Protein of unknown function [Actinacidiphila paucisporea]